MRIVLGAGREEYEEYLRHHIIEERSNDRWKADSTSWIMTTPEFELNLASAIDFDFMFMDNSVDNFLAEHVWEHLPLHHLLMATRNCYRKLKPGGRLRIAVPDT